MTRDEAVSRIQLKLGFRSDQAVNIQNALQDKQRLVEQRPELPWWLVTEVSSISTVVAEERVQLPTDFLREYEDPAGGDQLWYFNGSAADVEDVWRVLVKHDMETLRDAYPGTGSPRVYALTGDYFRIGPTPDAIYTLKMMYYKQDTVLTSNIENGWLKHFPEILIGRAGVELGEPLRDAQAIEFFRNQYLIAEDMLDRAIESRAHVNRRYIMGGVD